MTPRKIVAFIVSAVMAVAVVAGLFVAGSPSKERARQFDMRRVNDLQTASNAVDQYWTRTKTLPESLNQLVDKREYYLSSVLDPRTGDPYEYRVTGEKTYEMCALFETEDTLDSVKSQPALYRAYPGGYGDGSNFWRHGTGRVCYTLEVQTLAGIVPTETTADIRL